MIAALNRAFQLTRCLRAQTRAAMPADVEEGIEHSLAVAHHDDAFCSNGYHLVRSWFRNGICTTSAHPHTGEDLL